MAPSSCRPPRVTRRSPRASAAPGSACAVGPLWANARRRSLKSIVRAVLHVELDKRHTLTCSDWRQLPLSPEQILYAGERAPRVVFCRRRPLHVRPQPQTRTFLCVPSARSARPCRQWRSRVSLTLTLTPLIAPASCRGHAPPFDTGRRCVGCRSLHSRRMQTVVLAHIHHGHGGSEKARRANGGRRKAGVCGTRSSIRCACVHIRISRRDVLLQGTVHDEALRELQDCTQGALAAPFVAFAMTLCAAVGSGRHTHRHVQ